MTSFIIISKDQKKRTSYIAAYCKQQNIAAIDITAIQKDQSVKQNTQSIGIDDIKQMKKKAFLKPLQSKTKAIIVEDAQLLTTEAQNALLKILEEPPEHTLLFLSVQTKESLLPTILSRCQITALETDAIRLSDKEKSEFAEFITHLPELTIGEALKKAELLAKNKEDALEWLEKVIMFTREKLLTEVSEKQNETQSYYINVISSLQELHTLIKNTNVNLRFALEVTLLKMN